MDPWAQWLKESGGEPLQQPEIPESVGRGSWYSQAPGWVDTGDRPGSNALGVPDAQQGIALPTRHTLGQYFDVTFPDGKVRRLQQTDIGPAEWTGRGIDISAAAAREAGYTPGNFPTDARFAWKPASGEEPRQATPDIVPQSPWGKYLSGTPATPSEPSGGSPWENYLSTGGETPPAEPQTAPPAPAPQPTDHFSFTRGLVSSALKENPEGFADFLEGMQYNAPEGLQPYMQQASDYVRDKTKGLLPKDYEKTIGSMWDIAGVGDAVTWAGEQLGSLVGSTLVPLAMGGVGAAGGAMVGGPVGAAVGAVGGGFSGSFVQNYPEIYSALKEAGVDKSTANKYAMAATPFAAALDVLPEGALVNRLVKQKFVGEIAKRIAKEAGKTGATEAATESLQEVIKDAAVTTATDSAVFTPEQAKRWVETGVAGGLGGVVFGGIGGALAKTQTKPGEAPQTAEESAKQLSEPPIALPGEKEPAPVSPEAALAVEKPLPGEPPSPTVPPAGGEIRFEEPAPEPPFYSALMRATEKLPPIAGGKQIESTLKNQPNVKQAEIDDTGLGAFLASRPGNFTKEEVIEYLEENAMQVEETFSVKGEDAVRYGGNVAPGPTQGYFELRLSVPVKPGEEAFASPHWNDTKTGVIKEPNVVAHVQATTRVDNAGSPVLHIEGIQSDWHQLGRQYGYVTPERVRRSAEIKARSGQIKVEAEGMAAEGAAILAEYRAQAAPGHIRTLDEIERLQARSRSLSVRKKALSDEYNALRKEDFAIRYAPYEGSENAFVKRPPAGPFKSNWAELAMKRIYRYAADNGYSKVSWANPELAMLWNTDARGNMAKVSPKVQKGLTYFYGTVVPSRMAALAKRYNGVVGATEINITQPDGAVTTSQVMHVTVPEEAQTLIQRSMPMYDRTMSESGPVAKDVTKREEKKGLDPKFMQGVTAVIGAFNEFAKKFGIDTKIDVRVTTAKTTMLGGQRVGPGHRGIVWKRPDGRYELVMFAGQFRENLPAFYSTLMHEFGHIVVWEKFDALPTNTKLLIRQEFRNFQQESRGVGTAEHMLTLKRPAPLMWLMRHTAPGFVGSRVNEFSARQANYHLGDDEGFHEYMADQVSRWATTTAEPLTIVEKAWKGIATILRGFQEWMAKRFGVETRATLTVQNWLNSFLQAPPLSEQEYMRLDVRTQRQNQAAVAANSGDPNVSMPPAQPAVAPIRIQVNAAFAGTPAAPQTQATTGGVTPPPPGPPTGGNAPPGVPSSAHVAAAHADRITWIYELFGSILDLAQRNPRFTPLLKYIEKARDKDRKEKDIHDAALRIAKDWRGLGRKQEEALAEFIDELTNMTYLTPQEKKRGVVRHPTAAEIQTLARRIGVEPAGLQIAARIKKFTESMLDLTSDLARADAMRIMDPIKRQEAVDKINAVVRNMKAKPYFPFMRFGRHFVTMKNANGVTMYFETFERKGLTSAERQQGRKAEELRRLAAPGETVEIGMLPATAEPFHGMPPFVLDMIKDKLSLTPAQLDALNQLKFQLAPSQSFQHFFQHKKYVPGYSRDFLRAFSRYAFHGGRYYAKTLYVDGMRQDIRDARLAGGNVAHRIADFMSNHLENAILNVKGDYGALKGLMFLWAMGYSPASATLNMTQTPMITFPFLATHFGGIRAAKKISSALGNLSNFYKRGTYENMPEWQLRALGYGIRTGRIVETQAPQIAAMSQGGIFRYSSGGNAIQRAANQVFEKGAWMFEMAEQWNRRIAFRAALQLAHETPDTKIGKEAMARYPGEYAELTGKWSFTPAEAQAIVTAGHIVDRTQFVYAGWARPKFMRGKLPGSIFIFKRYLQSLLFLAGSDSKFFWRYALMAAMLGGLGGIPGTEDLKNMIQAVLRWMGFNADVEKEIRKYIKEYTNDTVPGDMVLHGLARRGFGIPAALDAMGSIFTGRPGRGFDMTKGAANVPYPQLDRSKAVTAGPIIPEAVWQLMDPSKSVNEASGQAASQVLGYGFSAAVNMFKAISDNHLKITDFKRWEKAEPRAIASLSKMYRALTEADPNAPGFTRERSGGPQSGTTVVRYDLRDTEQLMEVIAVGLGYNDLRRANEWDRIIHQNEHVKYIDMQRKGLLESFNEAKKNPQEREAIMAKIREFNQGLSPEDRAKAISAETIEKSVTGREKERIARERNRPTVKANVPIARSYEDVYPRTIEQIRR